MRAELILSQIAKYYAGIATPTLSEGSLADITFSFRCDSIQEVKSRAAHPYLLTGEFLGTPLKEYFSDFSRLNAAAASTPAK